MADVVSPEVQVRAIIKESGAPPPPIQPIVDSLRKALDDKSAEAALRLAANRDVNQAKINHAINEKIGTKRRADGTKDLAASPDSAARKVRADNIGNLLGVLTERGYDSLPPADQPRARDAILNLVDSYPAFQAVIGGPPPAAYLMTPGEIQQFTERILKDPAYKEKLVNRLRTLVDITGVDTDAIAQLEREFTEARAAVTRLNTEVTNATTRIDDFRNRINEYQPDVVNLAPPPPTRPGITFARINTLTGEIAASNAAIRTAQANIQARTRTIATLQENIRLATRGVAGYNPGDIPGWRFAIGTAEGDILTFQGDIETAESEKAEKTEEKTRVIAQEAELRRQLTDEETRRTTLETQRTEQQSIRTEKERALTKARADQRTSEEEFVVGMENALADAATDYINDQITTTTEAGRLTLEKQATDAKDAREKEVFTDLREKYFNGSRVDLVQIREDFNELMVNGPDNIIRDGLERSGTLTAAEVDAAMADNAFMEKMRIEVGKKVMSFHLLKGGMFGRQGRISADESLLIKNSEWGEKIINDALKTNKDWQKTLREQMGEGIIGLDGRISERFRTMDMGRLLRILLLLFGGGAAAMMFGPAVIGAAGSAVAAVRP